MLLFILQGCVETERPEKHLFELIDPARSGVTFGNILDESDDFNIIEYLYFYNGGGIAIGDINNDGLDDLYFSSNQKPNRLYLNKGGLVFEDISEHAGVPGTGNWKTGVTMADVNGDGLLDIFSCGVGQYKKFDGANTLYINNGDLTFSDRTVAYGLKFAGFSSQASFFDYDNDGDLDMYLVNHSVHTRRSYGHSSLRFESDPFAGDKLYRNDLTPDGNVHFTEVTSRSGILSSQIAYGLSATVSDFNKDGYIDIYVCNDFNENDYLYMNKGDGTFEQTLESSLPHTTRFSMGSDVGDIDNDGWQDLITMDMLPWQENVLKTTAGEDTYEIYDFKLKYGYHYQFSRNALQLNRGLSPDGRISFSDIAWFSGVAATDWSWSSLLADFDNDGNKDLFVTNGIKGRPNDLDYIHYIQQDSAQRFYTDKALSDQMPSGAVPNQIFRNRGQLRFDNVTDQWIGSDVGYSNGAAYSDLDNDGDLDLIVNNLGKTASLYRNNGDSTSGRMLKVKLEGEKGNRYGIGARVEVYAQGKQFVQENLATRGWLSSSTSTLHFGLGEVVRIDSVVVHWPGFRTQVVRDAVPGSSITFRQSESRPEEIKVKTMDTWLTGSRSLPFEHRENNYIPINDERLIPAMLSTEGPALAVGDVNGDKRDDFFLGGSVGQGGRIFIQQGDGSFIESLQPALARDSLSELIDAEFFDSNGDGFQDLVVVKGGQELKDNSPGLAAKLYVNNGRGMFSEREFPTLGIQASCVRHADIDGDGDMDLFVGGQVVAGRYGVNPRSFILINDGNANYKDETSKWMAHLFPGNDPGMVSDAAWADVNGDSRTDLVLVGQWMPVTILIQDKTGRFMDETIKFDLGETNGWWNSIKAEDMDNDGDVDLIVGNLGLNSKLRATSSASLKLYVGDIDGNNSLDHVMVYNNGDHAYPLVSRDQLVRQVPSLKKKFLRYGSFANVSLDDILTPEQQQTFIRKEIFTLSSTYFENSAGKYVAHPLPNQVQLTPVYAICTSDINGDGSTDVLMAGNLDAVQPDLGRFDAGYGMTLAGNSRGMFSYSPSAVSGFFVSGQVRSIKKLRTSGSTEAYIVARNNASALLFYRAPAKKSQ